MKNTEKKVKYDKYSYMNYIELMHLYLKIKKGKETVDYIADYLENIRTRRVFPDVTPGYIRELLPAEAPVRGEKWEDIFKDVERVIMPGVGAIRS